MAIVNQKESYKQGDGSKDDLKPLTSFNKKYQLLQGRFKDQHSNIWSH